MSDLISRQAAIDALQKEINKGKPPFDDVMGSIRCGVRLARNIIEDLPSAQPEPLDEWCTDCKEYDHERHCCPRWNRVIRQTLRDMKEEQPEPSMEECACCVLSKPQQKWIPCSERLPDKEVLCCDTRGDMIIGYPYQDEESNTGYSAALDGIVMIDCTAWMPLPEPYKEKVR